MWFAEYNWQAKEQDMAEKVFAAGKLPGLPEEWPEYRKKVTTHAYRIDGPFTVDTFEGPLRCEDGWLAIDARGYPYPIAKDEFDLIYEPVDPMHAAAFEGGGDVPVSNPGAKAADDGG